MDKPKITVSQISGPSIPFTHAGKELRAGLLALQLGSAPAKIGINSHNCRLMAYDEFVSFGQAQGFGVKNDQKEHKVIGLLLENEDGRILVSVPCDNVKEILLPPLHEFKSMTITLVVIDLQEEN